ncbi:MAG TPA: 50S ribosomal protein L18Ae [Candidatus Krumholzibacteriaceae bacterium]|jgi:large subunit ribosomal protein LX|nr:50S ribosomal protein L18Ae [Candidatus Krumholzibacteriaceae bacterium]
MSEVKIFRVSGQIAKPNWKTNFQKEVRALKPEEAKEIIYTELGSRHKAKRFQIKIATVEEVKPEDIQDPVLRKMVLGEARSVK